MRAQQAHNLLCPRNPGRGSLAGAVGSAMGGAGVGPMGMVKSVREAGDGTQAWDGRGRGGEPHVGAEASASSAS